MTQHECTELAVALARHYSGAHGEGSPAHMITKEYVYFTLNGFTYRTNGEDVEAAGGNRWNKTNSLPIILHARDIFATSGMSWAT